MTMDLIRENKRLLTEKTAFLKRIAELESATPAIAGAGAEPTVKRGMLVSMDISTGEDDANDRIFGRVNEVMLRSGGAAEDTILAEEESRYVAAPAASTQDQIRDAVLEEAAQMCFHLGSRTVHSNPTSSECADAIRALKSGAHGQGERG